MSRVFDALKRAGEEKHSTAGSSPANTQNPTAETEKPSEETPAWLSPKNLLTVGPTGTNGYSETVGVAGSNGYGTPKRWRERLEDLIFGWDIRRLKSHPIVALEKSSPVAEQYKIFREQIKRLRSDTGARCLAVTSAVKRDGKTMVAVNLAAAMALDYEGKILLIDGDLRRPEIHCYFGIQPSPGLGDYLSSTANGNLMGYVRETFIPGFQVLTGGKPSHFSSELLAQEKMTNLMEEIRSRFPEHQIILDAPPVLSTPDPLVLSRHVDGILVVIRAGKTPRDYVVKAVQSLNSAKLVGVVLNGVNLAPASKYYYHAKKN